MSTREIGLGPGRYVVPEVVALWIESLDNEIAHLRAEKAESIELLTYIVRWCECGMHAGEALPPNDVARGAGAMSAGILPPAAVLLAKLKGQK